VSVKKKARKGALPDEWVVMVRFPQAKAFVQSSYAHGIYSEREAERRMKLLQIGNPLNTYSICPYPRKFIEALEKAR